MQKDPETPFDKFAPHFGTNYAPTETEVAELKAILEVPDGQIRALDEEIAHKEIQLDELRKRREALKDSTKNHRALLSPIRRMPEDLLRDIFLACLPGDRYPTMSSDEAPMLLTRVSSPWRQVAHLTPRLWAAIDILVPSIPLPVAHAEIDLEYLRGITHRRIEAVNKWFQRSGLCPLRISLHESFGNEGNSTFAEFLIECLNPVRRRWKDLSLTGCTASLYPIQHLHKSEMPLLESLRLSFRAAPRWGTSTGGAATAMSWTANGILGCQRLTSLGISAVTGGIPWDTVKWEQLTTLILDGSELGWRPARISVMMVHMKSVLRKATALTSCTLHTGKMSWVDHSQRAELEDPLIELPLLEQLDIEEEDGASLLPLLRTPSLRSVSYRRNVNTNLGPPPLVQFLNSNIGIEIEEFITNNQSLSAEDLIECLRLCPALRLLHVNTPTPPAWAIQSVYSQFGTNHPLSSELLALFAPLSALDTDKALCPKLEDIEFLAPEANFSEADVVNFIERKQQSEDSQCLCRLRTIKVAFSKKSRGGEDVMAGLKPHFDAGLKVEFKYLPADSRGPLSLDDGLPLTLGTSF